MYYSLRITGLPLSNRKSRFYVQALKHFFNLPSQFKKLCPKLSNKLDKLYVKVAPVKLNLFSFSFFIVCLVFILKETLIQVGPSSVWNLNYGLYDNDMWQRKYLVLSLKFTKWVVQNMRPKFKSQLRHLQQKLKWKKKISFGVFYSGLYSKGE